MFLFTIEISTSFYEEKRLENVYDRDLVTSNFYNQDVYTKRFYEIFSISSTRK